MNSDEKYLARIAFQNKVYKSDGNEFQYLFVKVMHSADNNFQAVKPRGNQGDEKNDGFNKEKGEYYQVYAPERTGGNITKAITKCKTDFKGLIEYWGKFSEIKKFCFVFNDKYKGAYPELHKTIAQIAEENKGIKCDVFLSSDLEDVFLTLSDDDILSIVGLLPELQNIEEIDYSILNEVIGHILSNFKPYTGNEKLVVPDFIEKIRFNKLSTVIENLLTTASYQVSVLDDYFIRNSTFVKTDIKNYFVDIYEKEKNELQNNENKSDIIFMNILNSTCPKKTKQYNDTVLVLMSYFIESCDLFEEPK